MVLEQKFYETTGKELVAFPKGNVEFILTEEQIEKLKKNFEYYGFETERRKLNEEVFELQQELFRSDYLGEYDLIESELADILVVLMQFVFALDLNVENIKKVFNEKLDRQMKRIEYGNKRI